MEHKSLDLVIMFSIQRRLSLAFPQRNLDLMQNISRTTTLRTFPPLGNSVLRNSPSSQTNVQKIYIAKRKFISRKTQKYPKKKFVSPETKTILQNTSSEAESSTSQNSQFPSITTTNTTSSGQVNITSTITSASLYHSRYSGTSHIAGSPLGGAPYLPGPPPGYTHLSPESSSTNIPTLFPSGLTLPTSSTSGFEITTPESSRYEPTNIDIDELLFHQQQPSAAGNKKITNPIPRHKRESHINAEYRRRSKISSGFEILKSIVPSLRDTQSGVHQKESKSVMLNAATEYSRELKMSCDENERMEQRLRQEISELEREIQFFQSGLPVGGVPAVNNPEVKLQSLFSDYLQDRINNNWKFWIFSFLIRPLFLSFTQMITSSSFPAFLLSVKKWSDEKLQLNELRIEIIELLKYISTNTSVMSTPDQLPLDAFADFQNWQV